MKISAQIRILVPLAVVFFAHFGDVRGQDINLTGYTLTFSDEFDTLSVTTASPKGDSRWYFWPPYGPSGGYSASQWDVAAFSVSGGILSDKAWLDNSGNWHSGNLSSMDTTGAGFAQKYGYFEIRCKMPDSGNGAWPAFWLFGTPSITNPGQKCLEIDVFEWYGITRDEGQSKIQQATHNWNGDGGQNGGLYSPYTPMAGGAQPWQGYHIYGVLVDPVHITWYIDGVQTNQTDTPQDYITPMYVMVDYALGGGWPLTGMVNNSKLEVDWVRVYSLPAANGNSGSLTREVWTDVPGATVSYIPLTSPPNIVDSVSSFEAPTNWADIYGTRLRGYITAPVTGYYTFWIASDDNSELWISTNSNPAAKVRRAWVNTCTNPREWTREANQKSISIFLTQGQRYYVEALQKEAWGDDNLAVGWAKPGESTTAPSEVIPGSVLSPMGTGSLTREVWTDVPGATVSYIPLGSTPNIVDSVHSFEAPTNWADIYGTRIRGYITAPLTGSYTFWIASDDNSELWISTDSNPATKVKRAWVNTCTNPREWTREANQKSISINLTQGQRYYVEALQKEAWGDDNLAVGWAKPGESTTAPSEVIPGSVLSPMGAGSLTREVWTGVAGTSVSNIPVGSAPNITDSIASFEAPTNWADNYGTRVRGYITAPATGNYTFWIASDDNSELWISVNDNPANRVKCASVDAWTNSREWNRETNQKSASITLTQGQRYYIEALQKEGAGGDNLAVGWSKPGETDAAPSEVIPGTVLSPF